MNEEIENNPIWIEGDEAAKQGKGRDTCPYELGTENRKLWNMGYFGLGYEDLEDDR